MGSSRKKLLNEGAKTMSDYLLEIKNLTKDFPGVRAIDDVSFNIKRNTVHCLVGENGSENRL